MLCIELVSVRKENMGESAEDEDKEEDEVDTRGVKHGFRFGFYWSRTFNNH
jgi:hypothetical protein